METKVIRLEIRFTRSALVALLVLAATVGGLPLWTWGSAAASPSGDGDRPPLVVDGAAASAGNRIHYQGRLDGAHGPVQMTFSLYRDEAGATLLWSETKEVMAERGLINVDLGDTTALPYGLLDGQELWLGVGAGDAGEMRPRQEILPVPFAHSLRPQARIVGDSPGLDVLHVQNSTNAGESAAIYGQTSSRWGYAGHFVNQEGTRDRNCRWS